MARRSHVHSRRSILATGIMMAGLGPLVAQNNGESLRNAAAVGDADAVARLIGIGTPLETRDSNGRTALMLATHGNHIEAARVLIGAGADVNAKDAIADSPYLYAAAEGRIEILRMTLTHGADLKATNRYGGTGLIPACHHGHIEAVYALLKTAIDVNHVNKLGWTALLEAVILGDGSPTYVEIVEALVDAGAKTTLADRDGVSPLAHARQRGFHEIVAVLERVKR